MYAWCITSLARVFSSLLMRAIPSFLPLGFSIQSIFKTCIHLVASIRVGGGADVGELSTSLVSSFSVLSCPFRMIATMSCFKSHAIVLTLKFCINKRFKSYTIWKFICSQSRSWVPFSAPEVGVLPETLRHSEVGCLIRSGQSSF